MFQMMHSPIAFTTFEAMYSESPTPPPQLFHATNLLSPLSMVLIAFLFSCYPGILLPVAVGSLTCICWFSLFNYVRLHRFSYHLQGTLTLNLRSLIRSSFLLSLSSLVTILWTYSLVNHLQSDISVREEGRGRLILASWDMGAESGLTVVCFLLLVIKDKSRGNWSHIS